MTTVNSLVVSSSSSHVQRDQLLNVSKQGKVEEVRQRLKLGESVRERDHKGNTNLIQNKNSFPSKRSSKQRSTGIILIQNNNSPSPSQEKVANSLKSTCSSSTILTTDQRTTDDPEGDAYNLFEKAVQEAAIPKQIEAIFSMARLRLEKNDLFSSAYLVATAAHLARSIEDSEKSRQLNQIALQTENCLIGRKYRTTRVRYDQYRSSLEKIRSIASKRLKQNNSPISVSRMLSEEFASLLSNLVVESFADLGRPKPLSFAVSVIGSMARKEMAPYSDLELIFLVGKDTTAEEKGILKNVAKLLTVKAILIGESEYPILRSKRGGKSITPCGFSIDRAGLCPLGKKGIYSLIETPKKIADLQTEEWFRDHSSEVTVIHALQEALYLIGDVRLMREYKKRIQSILDSKTNGNSCLLRHSRSLNLLKGAINEFEVRLDQSKIALRAFDAKKELLRPIQMCISAVSTYFGLDGISTIKKIDQLQKCRHLSSEGAKRLRKVFALGLRLRILTHLFYRTEKDILYLPRLTQESEDRTLFLVTKEIQQELREAYRVIRPLFACAREFVKGNLKAFACNPLWDVQFANPPSTDRHFDSWQFGKALESAEAEVSLNPNDINARIRLSLISFSASGKNRVANLTEALSLAVEHKDEESIRTILIHLSTAYRVVNDYRKAAEFFKDAIDRSELSATPGDLITLAGDYKVCGQYSRAIHYYEQGLKVLDQQEKTTTENRQGVHPIEKGEFICPNKVILGDAASSNQGGANGSPFSWRKVHIYRDLAQLHRLMGNRERQSVYQAMLKELGALQSPGRDLYLGTRAQIRHDVVAGLQHLQNLEISINQFNQMAGNSYYFAGLRSNQIGDYPMAIEYCRIARQKFQPHSARGKVNQNVAMLGPILCAAYTGLGNADAAVISGKKAVHQFEGLQLPAMIVGSLVSLSRAYEGSGKLRESLKSIQQAEKIAKTIKDAFTNKSLLLAFARCYRLLGEFDKSLHCIQCYLAPPHNFLNYGIQLLAFAAADLELGRVWIAKGESHRAIDPLNRTLNRLDTLYEEIPNPMSGETHQALAQAYLGVGNLDLAIGDIHAATTLYAKVFGSRPSLLIVALLRTEGEFFLRLGGKREALETSERALAMLNRLTKSRPHFERPPILTVIKKARELN